MSALREPVNTITHMIGVVASVGGLIILIILTGNDWPKLVTMVIYGLSMILLYLASTLLHGVRTSRKNIMRLNRLDHMAIFLLIAGTYTPIAFNIFPNPWRWIVLGIVWIGSGIGMAFKLFSRKIHGFVNASIYVILSWGSAVPLLFAVNLRELIPAAGFFLLLGGGFIYSVGFLVYYFKKPDLWPGLMGHHELWHLFVMGGSLCHYLFILFYVVPFQRA